MEDRIFYYVDGESHYCRSDMHLKRVYGPDAEFDKFRSPDPNIKLSLNTKGHFLWEKQPLRYVSRIYYFTSIAGQDQDKYDLEAQIRQAGLEPFVIKESSQLDRKRQGQRERTGVIYKAKGVDIALATTMLEDAHQGNFTMAKLYTSDVDFLPVIQAVKRMGKHVEVVGHRSGLGENSPFLTVPDKFQDLDEHTGRFVRKDN
jgi:uncharacterized LabA/DUF88 family protein